MIHSVVIVTCIVGDVKKVTFRLTKTFNQEDSSKMVFNFLCEECKRIFNAEVDVLMLRNARSYEH